MGVRLTRFQEYFAQAKPVAVTSYIGNDLSSSFSMVVSEVGQLDPQRMVLQSDSGELVLMEEEIYRVGPLNPDHSLSVIMDGGVELRFTPVNQAGIQNMV